MPRPARRSGRSTPKGEVRDAIVNMLLEQPFTLTELVRKLHVSKSTVHYQLQKLLQRGVVDAASVRTVRGGVESRSYALKRGALLAVPAVESDRRHVDALSDLFERKRLELRLEGDAKLGPWAVNFLYHALLALGKTSRTKHDEILHRYGALLGREDVGPKVGGRNLGETLARMGAYWKENLMGTMGVARDQGPDFVVSFPEYFEVGAREDAPCAFARGLLDGVVESRYGLRYESVEADHGSDVCAFRVRRRKG
ncbi:MAG: ArsR family transcriptional regulator [Nitrososphaerota archaeon]|nr:ArsR family transcriptional regulator [Nitrososphaerota archaeon]MDG6939756.1 ArsR family transcriptional regulator [Nitrososphaerota archaeon]